MVKEVGGCVVVVGEDVVCVVEGYFVDGVVEDVCYLGYGFFSGVVEVEFESIDFCFLF